MILLMEYEEEPGVVLMFGQRGPTLEQHRVDVEFIVQLIQSLGVSQSGAKMKWIGL